MTLKLEAGKRYRTRGGDEVEILRTDVRNELPVAGIITYSEGDQWVNTWTSDGFHYSMDEQHEHDLISEIRPKRVVWLNVYCDGNPVRYYYYDSRKEADGAALPSRIACIRVEFEEGQFDD